MSEPRPNSELSVGQAASPKDSIPSIYPAAKSTLQLPKSDSVSDSDPLATRMIESLPLVRNRNSKPDSLQSGRRLGPYLLLSLVGKGPHGMVFEAEDTVRLRKVAIKVISPELAARGAAWIKHFLRATKTATRISHPGVLDVLSLGQEGHRAFYVMPYLPGRSLAALMRNRGVFALAEAIRVARQLAESLATVHSSKLTHGNIKPTNVFLDMAGQVKLADFALPLSERDHKGEIEFQRSVTTDLRSWAALFHLLLTGRPLGKDGEPTASIPDTCKKVIRSVFKNEPGSVSAAYLAQMLTDVRRMIDDPLPVETLATVGPTSVASDNDLEEPAVGNTYGKCLLLQRLGRGSTGAVFKARHQTLNTHVAVKILMVNGDAELRQQLRLEAQLLAQLNHPHIVRVWDFDDHPRRPFLVLEYVEGQTLAEVLRETGRLPAGRAIQIAGQIADGLAAAHRIGIVHRDVKPRNILLAPEGNAKLADLGLATCIDPHRRMACGGMVGTVAYVAPEQAMGATVDHRADVYSVGGTFYQMVTGELPFTGTTSADVLRQHSQEPLVPPHHRVPTLPERVSTVIGKMMAKRPEERQSSDQELLDDLIQLDRLLNPPAAARAPSWRLTATS